MELRPAGDYLFRTVGPRFHQRVLPSVGGGFLEAAQFHFERNVQNERTVKDTKGLISPELTAYQWNSGAAIAAGFIGAYLFTLQYLVGRVRNYELSPTSFLVASVSILEGSFIVAVVRHLTAHSGSYGEFTVIAFLLGYFPTFGITWIIERMRVQNLKQIAPAAYNRRFVLPTDMIDGVDMQTKFRLMEAGVQDVQNLATANPVLLYVETPYGLLTILDWIAQAQLIVAFGGDIAADLRQIGVRTTFDIRGCGAAPDPADGAEESLVWFAGKHECPRIGRVVRRAREGDVGRYSRASPV